MMGSPAVSGVAPSSGRNDLPTSVTISGTDLAGATGLKLNDGQNTALSIVSNTAAQIEATVPAGVAPGSYDVIVTTPVGSNSTSSQQFTVREPSRPSISNIVFSANTVSGQAPATVTVTVTFDEAVKADPAPTISFTKTPSSTGSIPGTVSLVPRSSGPSDTVFTGSFVVTHLSNGVLTASFSATGVDDNLVLTTQPSSGNTITVNLIPPPDTEAPTATVTVLPGSNVTTPGILTITLKVSDNRTPVVSGTPTIDVVGPLASLQVTGREMTPGPDDTFTFTLNIRAQAGVNGSYIFKIDFEDSAGNPPMSSAGGSFTVALTDFPLVTAAADAGPSQRAPGTIILDASASAFSGAGVTGVSYAWSQLSGPSEASPSLFNGSRGNVRAFFNAKTGGSYTFLVVVTSVGITPSVTASANVTVSVIDLAPVVVTRSPVIVRLPASETTNISLNASRTFDPNDDDITYSWTTSISTTAAVLTNRTSSVATLTVQSGVAKVNDTVELTATAKSISTSAQVLVIAATTAPPRASAGVDRAIVTMSSSVQIRLYGRDSYAPDNPTADPATTLSFAWSLESFVDANGRAGARPATFSNNSDMDPRVTLSTPGSYTFKLRVTTKDAAALSAEARVRVRLSRVSTGGVARAVIAAAASNASLSTTAASISAGQPTTVHSLTAQPGANVEVTLTGAAIGGGAGEVTYRWAVYDPTGQNRIQLTTDTGTTTRFVANANVAGTVTVLLQVARGGVQGLPARVRVALSRTDNAPPVITAASATSAGVRVSGATTRPARITSAGASPSIRLAIAANDAETAPSGLSYSVTQLVQSELAAQLTALGIDPTNPALGNTGGTTPRLEAFSDGSRAAAFSGGTATLSFNLRPVSATADSEAIGGAYVFAVAVSDPSGARDQQIVVVNVVDDRPGGRGLLNLGVDGASPIDTEEGTVYQVSTNLNASDQLVIDLTSTTDFKTGFRVASNDGTPTSTFTGFIRWEQVSGPTDFSSVLSDANLSNGGRGTFRLALGPAAVGDYVFKTTFDNGDAQSSSTVAASAAPAGAAPAGAAQGGGVSNPVLGSGGGCALAESASGSRSGNGAVSLFLLFLPWFLHSRRNHRSRAQSRSGPA